MSPAQPGIPTFWTTVRLLLGASRRRANGRQQRQQKLLYNRTGRTSDWNSFAVYMTALMMLGINIIATVVLEAAVTTGERLDIERSGKMVVSRDFFQSRSGTSQDSEQGDFASEANRIARDYGGSASAIEQHLRQVAAQRGWQGFVILDQVSFEIENLPHAGPFANLFGSLVLFWWMAMLLFQGEGLEIDLQRRRHPMWEWQLSHPVPPGAVFLAEMLAPIAGNPLFWSAPLFVGILFGMVYGFAFGALATLLIGVPVTIALACAGKALEVAVILRTAPRTRGALVGLMSWIGYASLLLFFLVLSDPHKIVAACAPMLRPLTALPWPWLALLLGQTGGSWSFPLGALVGWLASALATAVAVWFSVWATQKGLAGAFAAAENTPARVARPANFGREPLYRKEFLWFARDRSAIVQTILIPITFAAYEAFNMRPLLSHAQGAWNYLSGVAIVFGTFFLWVLGPKSLASEGSALWIATTWPRGLESLLKAKAWLWSLISCALVALVLAYALFVFPNALWKIALVALGWFFFSRSMAEKTVTLVTVPSESGETHKIPAGRRWAAQLGMLTFAVGIVTQQWTIAIVGIVYSYVTAAAMWQNFRFRLPFLFDEWSETVPPPPTLMHAMIAISILIEAGAVVTGVFAAVLGHDFLGTAQAASYAVCAVGVGFGTAAFLARRGVLPQAIWYWNHTESPSDLTAPWWQRYGLTGPASLRGMLIGLAGGVGLGFFARGWLAILLHIPQTAEAVRTSQHMLATQPELHISYVIMAVCFAPLAEEYLFRGILFRALDREWGGWRAILGAAAFFAIYHPALGWLPVFTLGAANCLIFKRTGRLAPAVLLHMAYNAVVLF